MMDRAKLVAGIETALSEVLEREVTGLTEDTRADGLGGHRRDLGRPGSQRAL